MKKIKKMKYKIVTIMLSLITLATTALPASAVYADDTITTPNTYCVQDGNMKSSSDDESDPHILGYYSGELTLEETQKYICFYCWGKEGNYMKLQPIYNQKYINWNSDFYYTITYSDHVSTSSTLCQNNFSGRMKYYIFNSKEEANAYLATGDSSGAINSSDVIEDGYNGDIPMPDSFEITYLDSTTVDCRFSYDNDSELTSFEHELNYEIVPDYVYATSSFTKAIVGGTALGATGQAAKFCQYIESTVQGGIMVLPTTVEDYIANPSDNKDKLYTQEDKTPITGTISSVNARSLTPTDYSGQFAASSTFGAFWGGATNVNVASFVGSQLTLRLYYEDNGQKVYSNKVVVRYFSNDIINELVGKKKTVIGKGDDGEDVIIDDGPVDPTEPLPDIPDIDVVNWVKSLYTQITSYLVLTNQALAAIPSELWVLVMTSLVISLVLIVFKVLRGM